MNTQRPGSARVRVVVVAVLWLDVAAAVALAGGMVRPDGALAWASVLAVLTVHAAVHALVLYAVVTPWWEQRTRDRLGVALVAATALAAPVLAASGAPGEEPWAWLLGFSVGALAVLRWRSALCLLAAGVVVLLAGVGLGAGSVRDGVVFAVLAAVLAGGFALLVVWMLRVLISAEEGRAAQARLAVADERLRVARDLHDVLGHRLSVLALRAEVVGDAESQELANRTLAEVRAAVHGYGTVDLDEQLTGAELVLATAGVQVEVTGGPARLGAPASQLLGAALRESVTNVLRHSEARRCRIALTDEDGVVHLRVTNDGVDAAPDGFGTGLSGLAERARLIGASLRTERDGDAFTLLLDVPR